jgi:hypothetical protein
VADNYPEALKHAYKALQCYDDIQYKEGIAQASLNIGDYYVYRKTIHSQ